MCQHYFNYQDFEDCTKLTRSCSQKMYIPRQVSVNNEIKIDVSDSKHKEGKSSAPELKEGIHGDYKQPHWGTMVEKNDEEQKIEQDGIKPEDKAHKAATKIQASFRGHITRKKLKGEKKGDAQAAEAEMNEKKDDAPVADGAEKKEGEGPTTTEAAPATGPKPEEAGKGGEAPSEEKKGEGASDAAAEQAAPQAPAPSEEKAGSAETESATKASTDNSPSSKAEDAPAKEEPKQADVPAAVTAAAATTPAAEDAATKATTQPPTEASEGSQAEDKIETVRNENRAFPKQDKFNRPSPLGTKTCPSPHPPTVLKEANSLYGLSPAEYDSLTPFSPKDLTG
ncbi:Neuromodulin [Myotis brandtii]|uniref:Neuromodulin n=1 Tax=Myotis brandtii TaxID=109478 RepID=S7N848_MYOBR|nr:Neuromodulin [Myotis brandtii]